MDINPISFRLRCSGDDDFIFSSWSSSEKFNTNGFIAPYQLYHDGEQKRIEYLLGKSQVMIAHTDGKKDEIISYTVYQFTDDTLIIHYGFTKSPFRRRGIQQELISLINLLNFPIVLTCSPDEKAFKRVVSNGMNIIYDSFYFTRGFYNGK